MKTAIVGLPMVGKTSLFTILTGVHEATRVGLMDDGERSHGGILAKG